MQDVLGGRYKIIRKIGGGGMAIVYLAEDIFLNRQVAVKVLREEYVEDPEFIRHFRKEAKSIAALNHPNIVNIYDFDASADPAYLVMEFVEGMSVKQIVEEEGSIPWEQAADIGIQVARGLAEAHRHHIVHKDVKSHNILVEHTGMVKITDFGIAQMLSSTTITHNKGILGSAHYFSPEQARGERVDEKSDIYSLGIVLYEMLCGQVPFTGDNPVTVALKHIQEKPIPPQSITQDVPEAMEAIVLKCLQKDKNLRFQDMTEVAEALEAVRETGVAAPAYHQPVDFLAPEPAVDPLNDTLALPRNLTQKHGEVEANQVSEGKASKKNRWPKGKKKRLTNFLILVLVLLAAFGTLKIAQSFAGGGDIEVPSVVGFSYADAEEIMDQEGLRIREIDSEYSDEVEKGAIISQDPIAGKKVKKGRLVGVVISRGPEKLTVPKLTGKTEDEARALLEDADLELGEVKSAYDSSIEAGQIISQSPSPGKKVDKNTAVRITVSLGKKPEYVTVPDVRGMKLSDAKAALSEKGLVVAATNEEESSNDSKGRIIGQSLEPGSQVEKQTSLTLTIGTGKHSSSTTGVNVTFDVPENGVVVVTQTDANGGETMLYRGVHQEGEHFSKMYNAPSGSTITASINGKNISQTVAE
ncbi:Stk1 family PASTA domain-containing Ser/Thr kinase [Peptococcus niger]|uniref:non-specific serine/threonine protein kinase n=1 Tax=Peptococcus niger TaxID=2741 RepID=A0A1G6RQQ8_PEPNI|nr:Stk1 family PASTA domain-containing Ser/Thr kinase [Peptococcus niger]SDD06982.1 serine/threonine protein kinase [Peptococcus niger]